MASDSRLGDILELARNATPGPWFACTWDPMETPHISREAGPHHPSSDIARGLSEADARYLGALEPEIIGDIISELLNYRNQSKAGPELLVPTADIERLRAALTDIAENFNHTPGRHEYQSEKAVPFQRYGWCGPCRAHAALEGSPR